jgi:multidrug efflux pump subunit AcrB
MKENHKDRGILAWFASNRVAANLLLILVIVGGLLSLRSMKIEIFPDLSIDMIKISVPYLGASPSEVEEGVVIRIEEAIAGIEGIKRLRSVAAEGMGTVIAELEEYADNKEVLDDIKEEVDRIETFPKETEKPIITELTTRSQVLTIVLYGDAPERTLKNLAEIVRDDLTTMGNISQVEFAGIRRYEISIEVSEENLRRYGLSFDQVANAIRRSSLDVPGGSIETSGGEILVRTKGQRYVGPQFERIVVLTRSDGTNLYLSDIATVIDGFEDSDMVARFDGKKAVMVNVFRVGEQGALDVAETVERYVEQQQSLLPEGVSIATWFDRSKILRSRLELLIRHGYLGLILVFLTLTLFLSFRLSFWTAFGIPFSFLGSLWLLPLFDVSINMISLFAFIVVLGLVVDDAIVIGENIFFYRQKGVPPLEASIRGVKEMAAPVTGAILTTVVAFLPLLFTSGTLGKIMKTIPIVVISVLLISLCEALLILPCRLNDLKLRKKPWLIGRMQNKMCCGLDSFINNVFSKLLNKAINWRYLTLAIGTTILLITIGFVGGGYIKFTFLPKIEADNMWASLTMPQGTLREQTETVVRRLEKAVEQVRREFDAKRKGKNPSIVRHMATNIGEQPFDIGGPGHDRGAGGSGNGGHLAEVNVELLESENREFSSVAMANRWREIVGEIPGVSSLTFTSSLFTAGEAVNIELAHRDFDTLLQITERIKDVLSNYQGAFDIADNFETGKAELQLSLNDQAHTLGLTLSDLARQVRQGFYGEEVQRIQRDRDDIRIMVRYPEAERKRLSDIEKMRIRLVDGTEIPFSLVADVREGRGYATINRADRRRVVTVTADVDETIANANEINQDLGTRAIPLLQQEYPGLTFTMGGEQEEQQESLKSLRRNFIIAIFAIFALLAIQFKSYIQPVIIMSAIPFGLVGAVVGHVIMGLNLTMLSLFGIVALTGVVVNDSLIMIDLINWERAEGVPLEQVVRDSATRRFRPIMLTTLTTFFGLTPMILEKSLQARFLIPMAVSLGFGILFATAITLLLVPSLYMILEDIKVFFGK